MQRALREGVPKVRSYPTTCACAERIKDQVGPAEAEART